MKVILIILDSVGIGESPDAADYGDEGANTLAHIAEYTEGINIPFLQEMGIGNIPTLIASGYPVQGVPPVPCPSASFGAMHEMSQGKDTTTGHWEIAGIELKQGFHIFPKGPPSFPAELMLALEKQTSRKIIGNKAASGTKIIDELGPRQMEEGCWIMYTSADSVLQIAAHEKVISLEELYGACEIARKLCDAYNVGRIIARPYIGKPGSFQRTENRRDYSCPPPEPTVLDNLTNAGIAVYAVGKIEDIFVRRGITQSFHTGNNNESQAKVMELVKQNISGLIFANFIDFDMLYGHRRDADGYARALQLTDSFFGELIPELDNSDILIITADHGNDPTFRGTDHTREYVPLLVYQPSRPGYCLGIRQGFYDVAQSLASAFHIRPMPRGISFLP